MLGLHESMCLGQDAFGYTYIMQGNNVKFENLTHAELQDLRNLDFNYQQECKQHMEDFVDNFSVILVIGLLCFFVQQIYQALQSEAQDTQTNQVADPVKVDSLSTEPLPLTVQNSDDHAPITRKVSEPLGTQAISVSTKLDTPSQLSAMLSSIKAHPYLTVTVATAVIAASAYGLLYGKKPSKQDNEQEDESIDDQGIEVIKN